MIPNISDLLQPLEDAIFHHFIPTLVSKLVSDVKRALFALPIHLGGLGISNPQALSNSGLTVSVKVTQPLFECYNNFILFKADIAVYQCQAKTAVVTLKQGLQSTKAF